ncbi:hypothetical protein EYW49_15850 [Siculibacillus lacustris]|uniref:DUF5681 domain-containing protein n=1 Tax=Siculibacillus lacustris TaxID=1549641 RepID=A0A4Q9VK37_9HYPH|nr:DUF5681 domain-containing protein [Siculibacillus lacustris]TBW35499.1 hypothetical protein EYW49_15850 [Siculibacillus lacustris]
MANDDDTHGTDHPGDYDVGYGRPPVHTRFQPGRSGNPRGRPPRAAPQAQDLAGTVAELLDEPIELMRGGRPVRMQVKRAIAQQLVNRAVKGDLKAFDLLDKILGRSRGRAEDQIRLDRGGDLSEIDEAVIERALRRRSDTPGGSDGEGGMLQ